MHFSKLRKGIRNINIFVNQVKLGLLCKYTSMESELSDTKKYQVVKFPTIELPSQFLKAYEKIAVYTRVVIS
jgi:hypothetical protein